MEKDYNKYLFIKRWKKHYINILTGVFPQLTKKEIDSFLDDMIKENIRVPKAKLDNNYMHISMDFDLLSICDWIKKTKPVCAGHGVFFRDSHKVLNPAAVMLADSMAQRKSYKDTMKTFKEGTYEYDMYDRFQVTEKVVANSYYGGSGSEISDYFNLYTATCTTSTAQSLISTTMLAFEAFMTSNIQFFDLDDCLNYTEIIRNEKYKLDERILPPVSHDMLYMRLVSMFHEWNDKDSELLCDYILSLDDITMRKIYYKNNLYEFSKIRDIHMIISDILHDVDEFKNPNKIPPEIKDNLNKLWKYYEQFVFTKYYQFGRIKRLKAFKRKAVVTIDTDSKHIGVA